jgi:hypothetical protein
MGSSIKKYLFCHLQFAITLSSIYITAPKCDASWDTFRGKDGADMCHFIVYNSCTAHQDKAMHDVNISEGFYPDKTGLHAIGRADVHS